MVPRAERPAVIAVVLLCVLAGAAEAHIAGARPIFQRAQVERIVDLQPDEVAVELDLELTRDTLRHLVTHRIDPRSEGFYVAYREHGSIDEAGFLSARWHLTRIVEFRDLNVDSRFEAETDSVVRAWQMAHYDWRREAIQTVQLQDVTGQSVVWRGNLTSGPSLRLEVAFAGKDFTDEGAIVRPQDVILYLDVTGIPPRDIGSLYAIEFTVATQEATRLSLHASDNTSTAILADQPLRRGLLVWGGEGFLDGQEQRLVAEIVDESASDGNRTARLVLTTPTVDRSMRFVMVSGVEYNVETKRGPLPVGVALGAVGIALLLRRTK